MTITVYYNPKCGTCRKVREAIEKKGFKPRIVEYLKTPPSISDLDRIGRALHVEPRAMARTKEPVFARVAARAKTREAWLEALHENPILLQRPIVEAGGRVLIARPAETIGPFLESLAEQ